MRAPQILPSERMLIRPLLSMALDARTSLTPPATPYPAVMHGSLCPPRSAALSRQQSVWSRASDHARPYLRGREVVTPLLRFTPRSHFGLIQSTSEPRAAHRHVQRIAGPGRRTGANATADRRGFQRIYRRFHDFAATPHV